SIEERSPWIDKRPEVAHTRRDVSKADPNDDPDHSRRNVPVRVLVADKASGHGDDEQNCGNQLQRQYDAGMRDDFPDHIAEQIELRTTPGFGRMTNKEADDYKGDNNDRRCAVEIERQRQWQVIALAEAVGACRSRERASRQCRRHERRDRAGYAARSVHASAAELRLGQWVPRECDCRPTLPGVPEPE